jgi:hypothetical protein
MKSKRRHDLQHNELLEWLTGISDVIKPHANAILICLILVLGAYVATKIWSFRSGETTARAWDSLYAAMNSGEITGLDRVSEEYSSNEVGDWARVVSADLRLASGCDQLFGDKIAAGQELQKAMDSYLTVLEASTVSSIRERATFGLARTYEAMAGTRQSQGELKKAQEKYEEVVDNWPEGVFAKSAKRRSEDLSRTATKEFYDQFAAHDPNPAFDPAGGGLGDLPFGAGSLSPGSAPRDFSNVLGSPGLSEDDGAKDDSMENGGEEEVEPTDSKKGSDTPEGQPAPEQAEKGSDADSAEKPELSPPAAETPTETETE